MAKLEPTPDNYARAYAQESGIPGAENWSQGPDAPTATAQAAVAAAQEAEQQARAQVLAWASMAERLSRNLSRVGRHWTAARRKDSLTRVFDGSRSDPNRLHQRLQGLMKAWEGDQPAEGIDSGETLEATPDRAATAPMPLATAPAPLANTSVPWVPPAAPVLQGSLPLEQAVQSTGDSWAPLAAGALAQTTSASPHPGLGNAAPWPPIISALECTVRAALPEQEPSAAALAQRLAVVAQALAREGATPVQVAQVETLCNQARRWLGERHHLIQQLTRLCRELGGGLAEMVDDGTWVQGQCQALVDCLQTADGSAPRLRAVRSAGALLAEARQRQRGARVERAAAQQALKALIQNMLLEVSALGEHTGRFQAATAAHAKAIKEAPSLESLAGVVENLLADSRAVHEAVHGARGRLQADHVRARELEARVRELESELRRLSDEVLTDALTKVANRRGLSQAFEHLCARQQRDGGPGLCVGLIDIDNFKRLNDTLGHAAGDLALQNLARQVQARLRPADHLARFGGEEFVVLIPGTAAADAQLALTRLQRSLSEALFLHEGREVFVTFSAGVTNWVPGETLEDALGRADTAMYEAKRSGKNTTCVA
jgi:diguanylate cyclase